MSARWLRRLGASPLLDVAAGVVLTVATWIEEWGLYRHAGPGPWMVLAVLAVPMGVPLAWRRRAPLVVMTVVVAAALASSLLVSAELGAQAAGQGPLAPFLAVLLAVFSFGAYAEGRRVVAGAAVLAAALGVSAASAAVGGQGADWGFWVATAIFWIMGLLFRQRLLRVAELQAQADQLRQGQAERARWAVIEERSRIARELHDVIAHSVSVMVVQAAAARHTLDPADIEMREALQAVETAGREALGELRRLLGILRRPDDEPALAPVPGLGRIRMLVEQMREAGLPTELRVEGEPAEIAPGVDLTAYRVIQEALTNALKHAGPAQARVSIRYRPRELDLEVSDNGHGADEHGVDGCAGGGHGLAGMRERVTLYGGTLDAGRGEAGFTVHARLPLDRATP